MRPPAHMAFLSVLALFFPLAAGAQREAPVPKELRERFGEWAEKYPSELPNYAATETVQQTRWSKRGLQEGQRQMVYQYRLQRLPATRELVESRAAAVPGAAENKSGAKQGNNRFSDNLAEGYFSKLALLVTSLASRHHEKVKYFFPLEDPNAVSEYVVVGYRQFSGEALMEVEGKAVYPWGKAWVDPEDGRVARIEEEIEFKDTHYWIGMDLDRDNPMNASLPVRIVVRLFVKGHLEVQNEYTYSDFRRLEGEAAATANPSPHN